MIDIPPFTNRLRSPSADCTLVKDPRRNLMESIYIYMNLGVIYTVLTSPELVFQKHTGLPAGCHLGCSFVAAPFQTFSTWIRAFPLAMSSASDISTFGLRLEQTDRNLGRVQLVWKMNGRVWIQWACGLGMALCLDHGASQKEAHDGLPRSSCTLNVLRACERCGRFGPDHRGTWETCVVRLTVAGLTDGIEVLSYGYTTHLYHATC